MIMPKLRNMSIRQKLTAIIMLTTSLVLLLVATTFIVWRQVDSRRHLINDMCNHACIIADNCKASLAFSNENDAKQVLSSLHANDAIVFACIYDKQGRVFAEYQRKDITEKIRPPQPQKDSHAFENGYLSVFRQIELDNEIIGTVYLLDDMRTVHSELMLNIVAAIVILLFALLIAYLLTSKLQKVVSGPILSLAEVAKDVSEKKDYSVRALKQSNDEVGWLIDAFNQMLEQIHHRDLELVKAKEQLETRVRERTAELTAANQQLVEEVAERERAQENIKRVNQELMETTERANEMAAQADTANAAKSQFLAAMSHEIRTPMNAIIGFTEMLSEAELTNEQKEYLSIIRDSGQNLLWLIDDILDLSKIEAGKLDMEFSECSLGQLLNSVESLMQPRAKEKGLDFEILEDSGLPARTRTEMTRVRQCLINLVGNAIKFTREGHVYLRISLQEIEDTPFIRFDVEDTGIGIPQDKQEEIFGTFVQVDGSSCREYGGTGLGLAISKRLADLLGGQLTLTSEFGKGSVFSLTIPAGVDVTKQPFLDRQNIAGHIDAGKDEAKQAKFSGHILVAEDARTNQVLIKSLLKRVGLQVTVAEDGNEVVQKALATQFDLIFMDIEMPNMNGCEATKALRKEGLRTPIVALTAYAMKGDDKKCFAAGCDDYISKPIEHQTLLHILSKYLSAKSGDMSRRIDSVKSEVEQFNQLCSDTASSDTTPTEPADEQYGELPVDFAIINKIYDDKDVLKETVKMFLEEAPQTIELLAEAIEAKNSQNVKLYAHKLKGSAMHVAAGKLSDKSYRLECIGREGKLEGAGALFADIQAEFEKLKSFLSQPDWMESAEQQTDEKEKMKKAQEII